MRDDLSSLCKALHNTHNHPSGNLQPSQADIQLTRKIKEAAKLLEIQLLKTSGVNSTLLRGKEIFSFEYDDAWLKSRSSQTLDPDLGFFSGIQYLNDEKPNFGIFLDSSPDRWGRTLMDRREAAIARSEERQPKNLFETDYLLGVYDGHRMGAIRFKDSLDGPYLNSNTSMATPPWALIRELEHASLKCESRYGQFY